MRYMILTLCLFSLVGCHVTAMTADTTVATEATGQNDEMFSKIASLAGEWKMVDPEGKEYFFEFDVTAGGSCVREIMFPGQPHEMTNLYHMNGDEIVVTHYCAAGNQPRMVASYGELTDAGLVFAFDFESVTNLRKEHDHYMGNYTLTLLADGGVRQDWRSYDMDGELTEPVTFMLNRTKDAKTMRASYGR